VSVMPRVPRRRRRSRTSSRWRRYAAAVCLFVAVLAGCERETSERGESSQRGSHPESSGKERAPTSTARDAVGPTAGSTDDDGVSPSQSDQDLGGIRRQAGNLLALSRGPETPDLRAFVERRPPPQRRAMFRAVLTWFAHRATDLSDDRGEASGFSAQDALVFARVWALAGPRPLGLQVAEGLAEHLAESGPDDVAKHARALITAIEAARAPSRPVKRGVPDDGEAGHDDDVGARFDDGSDAAGVHRQQGSSDADDGASSTLPRRVKPRTLPCASGGCVPGQANDRAPRVAPRPSPEALEAHARRERARAQAELPLTWLKRAPVVTIDTLEDPADAWRLDVGTSLAVPLLWSPERIDRWRAAAVWLVADLWIPARGETAAERPVGQLRFERIRITAPWRPAEGVSVKVAEAALVENLCRGEDGCVAQTLGGERGAKEGHDEGGTGSSSHFVTVIGAGTDATALREHVSRMRQSPAR